MKSLDEILAIAAAARHKAAGSESAIWAENTRYTAESLEALYEGYVIQELEADHDDYWDFPGWCEHEMHIQP